MFLACNSQNSLSVFHLAMLAGHFGLHSPNTSRGQHFGGSCYNPLEIPLSLHVHKYEVWIFHSTINSCHWQDRTEVISQLHVSNFPLNFHRQQTFFSFWTNHSPSFQDQVCRSSNWISRETILSLQCKMPGPNSWEEVTTLRPTNQTNICMGNTWKTIC